MSAAKKFKNYYPKDTSKSDKHQMDKKLINDYVDKIAKLLQNPENQKKAAEILRQMINHPHKK